MSYTFLHNDTEITSPHPSSQIYTVPTDSYTDSGSYKCKVTVGGVDSLLSAGITVKIVRK